MINATVVFARSWAVIDGATSTPGAVVTSSTGGTDKFGQPRLLAGQALVIATDRASSVSVTTNAGTVWLDSGAGPITFTAPESLTVRSVAVQPALSTAEKTVLASAETYPTRQPAELETQTWLGNDFLVQRPVNSGTFRRATNRRAHVRFEIRPGWVWARDAAAGNTNERCELAAVSKVPFDTDAWVSMPMLIETGPNLESGHWAILGQFWATEDLGEGETLGRTPTFRHVLYDDGSLEVATASSTTRVDTVQPTIVPRWSVPNFTRGVWHHFVHRMQFSQSGGGYLQSWLDGVQMFNAAIPLGYNDAVGPTFKFGIYRKASTVDTLAVQYRNVEHGTASLASRITNPLPIS